ncbi:SCO2524 family protein [Dactylosporangium sp. NPDC000244]|uniref:SCO2524 family protein n=1 Tax=Dactylosporangium sp. NPDC000244 TaxID=3154365 RepID=UPI003327ACA1
MKISPRHELLDVWRAVARESMRDGQWVWGGRAGRNCVHDAEQLLCIMAPAAALRTFALDRPDETVDDIADALRPLGDVIRIPRMLLEVAAEYLTTYTDEAGQPAFGGGSYFRALPEGAGESTEPTEEQRAVDTVGAYAVSVRLTLAVLGFTRVFRRSVNRQDVREQIARTEQLASLRLTAALVGLLRSFSVSVFPADSPHGRVLMDVVNQAKLPDRRIHALLQDRLVDIRAVLRDIWLGPYVDQLDNPNMLFECGWSWGVPMSAPPQADVDPLVGQPDGVAVDAPNLAATAVVLDALQELWSDRTRLLGLLYDDQQRLASALQLRWDITQRYWTRIACFGDRRWPLEDVPWRASDGIESDYLSLLVCSIVIQDLQRKPDAEAANRIAGVLAELAGRARLTRRAGPGEWMTLHHPGFPLPLAGSEDSGGPRLVWDLFDFAPQLLKQAVLVGGAGPDIALRLRVADLVDEVWGEHILRRRLRPGLWDQPAGVYDEFAYRAEEPFWSFTERVVSALISVAQLVAGPPLRSGGLAAAAADLLAEADHVYDQELFYGSTRPGPHLERHLTKIRATLDQAHERYEERPGTALVLAMAALRDLAQLDAARRHDTGWGD